MTPGRGPAWTLLVPPDPPQARGTSDEGRRGLGAPRQRGPRGGSGGSSPPKGSAGGRPPGLTLTPDEIVAELRDGMTIGIGGWGSRRKPMALVRAILRSPLRDLTIVSYAGPDVGLLLASGQARRVVTGFASLDSIALEPHFRRARQAGKIGRAHV